MNRTQSILALFLLGCLVWDGMARGGARDIRIGVSGVPAPAANKPANAPAASPHVLRLEKVEIAAFLPDGKLLLTVGEQDNQVHLWNVQTGEEVNRFGDAVTHAIFSTSGTRVMTWGDDEITRIFDTRTGKALRRLDGAGTTLSAGAISPDGTQALTCATDEKVIKLWDTASGKTVGTLEAEPATALAFSPDGKQAVSLSGSAAVVEIPPQSQTPFLGAKGEHAAVAPTTPAKASAASLRLWDLQTRKVIQKIDLPAPAQWPYFSANGKLVLVVVNNAAKIYDLSTGKTIPAPRTPEEHFPAGSFTGDRKIGLSKGIGSAAIINAANNEKIRPLEGPIDGMPICNAFSEDGMRVILGTGKVGFFSRSPDEPGKVYVFEVATGKRLAAFEGHARQVTQVSLSADATHAFSRDTQKTLFLWALPH
jgi:WD40 repeat protein